MKTSSNYPLKIIYVVLTSLTTFYLYLQNLYYLLLLVTVKVHQRPRIFIFMVSINFSGSSWWTVRSQETVGGQTASREISEKYKMCIYSLHRNIFSPLYASDKMDDIENEGFGALKCFLENSRNFAVNSSFFILGDCRPNLCSL